MEEKAMYRWCGCIGNLGRDDREKQAYSEIATTKAAAKRRGSQLSQSDYIGIHSFCVLG